jgi:hypothetical protein
MNTSCRNWGYKIDITDVMSMILNRARHWPHKMDTRYCVLTPLSWGGQNKILHNTRLEKYGCLLIWANQNFTIDDLLHLFWFILRFTIYVCSTVTTIFMLTIDCSTLKKLTQFKFQYCCWLLYGNLIFHIPMAVSKVQQNYFNPTSSY